MTLRELAAVGNITLSIGARELIDFVDELRHEERDAAVRAYKLTHDGTLSRTYSLDEVAEHFGKNRRTIERWIESGMTHPMHPGGEYRFSIEDIQELESIR